MPEVLSTTHHEWQVKLLTPVQRLNASQVSDGLGSSGDGGRWKYECANGNFISISADSVIIACGISERSNGQLELASEDGMLARKRINRWIWAGRPCGSRCAPCEPSVVESEQQSVGGVSKRSRRGGIVWPRPATCTCPKDKDCWWASTGKCPQ